MTANPYIRHGNIFFVPVLRHRLNFAVLVQRALYDLHLDHHDLIAVGLPASVEKPIREAIQKLPRISLIISSVSDSDQREVFPVTPADGIIEGIRTAIDHNIPLAFIDQELPPGHLTERICMADENWPDDVLALKEGAEWYVNFVAEQLTHPPSRYEPVDSWRELHMAMSIQKLFPFYRRILVICNAVHVQPVRRLLQQPPLFLGQDAPVISRTSTYKIWAPSLPILMSYLDYIPHLVELYEEQRQQGKAHTFDKRNALMGLMYKLQEDATDMSFSIRHYQAFAQMLTGMLEQQGQMSPRFEMVLLACRNCFNRLFEERVYRHLLGYYDQVKVMRIGKLVETEEPIYEIQQANIEDFQRIFVARSCTQFEQYFEIIYLPGKGGNNERQPHNVPDQAPDQPLRQIRIASDIPRPKIPWNAEWISSYWPPYGQFENAIRRRVYNLSRNTQSKQNKSIEFQGSLHLGVDFRRTLRSYLTDNPKLYIKTHKKSTRKPMVDHNEPILWLFQTNVTDAESLEYTWIGHPPNEDRTFVHSWYLAEKQTVVFNDTNAQDVSVNISRQKLLGVVYFVDAATTVEVIQAQFGSSFYERVPSLRDIRISSIGYTLDPKDILYTEQLSWWECLLLGAIYYAKETVLVVAPTDFTIPYSVLKYAHMKGKDIVQISLSQFAADEVRRLQMRYFVEHKYLQTKEITDPDYIAYLIENFSDVMKQFW